LDQNYPNPFNPTTSIGYQLADPGRVKLVIYNVLGQQIAVLVDDYQVAGSYEIEFDGRDLASGIYYYILDAGDFAMVRKMILLQ
jgi:hypothetical protein